MMHFIGRVRRGAVGWLGRFRNKKYVKFSNPTKTDVKLSYVEGYLDGLLSARGFLRIVQVGAHDGRSFDPISVFCEKNSGRLSAGFVEPQPDIFEMLKSNKSSLMDARFLNALITESGGSKPIFRLKKQYWEHYKPKSGLPAHCWPTAIASSDYEHVRRRVERYLADSSGVSDPSDAIEEIFVPCMSLTEAIDNLGLDFVDFIQVDAEGFDDKVIMSLDLLRCRPVAIAYEYAHISGPNYENLKKFLSENGYEIKRWSGTDEIAIDSEHDGS